MKSTESHHKQYLSIWGLTLALLLAAVIFFNFLVDPFGLFDTVRINGFNARKPAAATHARTAKLYQVLRYAPKTLIGGNSRPEMGLDPASACWPKDNHPIFNLGLPGSSTFMQARILQHALASGKINQVFWGVDFIDFYSPHADRPDPWQQPHGRTVFEKRLQVDRDGSTNPRYPWQKMIDHFQAVASLDSLKDSLITIFRQNDPYAPTIRRDGFNPASDYLDIIRWEGQWVLFAQKQRELEKSFSRPGLKLFRAGSRTSPQFESVRQLIEYANQYDTKVTLFINPYHINYLTTIANLGHWQAFETWKRRLTTMAANAGVTLWDFSTIHPITTEPVPPRGKQTIMRWFWEPAHYRKELGELMLSRMLQRDCGNDNQPSLFGYRLTPENIDNHLARSRKQLATYLASHPEKQNKFLHSLLISKQ